jgi:FemAB-related protein (PEP-CTERM system-associated)
MRVFEANAAEDGRRWDAFVDGSVTAQHYHRWGWKHVIERAFAWPTHFLVAEKHSEIRGLLPLVWQKSLLFGSFLTSLPFLNGGGILASDSEAVSALLTRAIELAKEAGAKHIEFRFRHHPALALPVKTNKVSVTHAISGDTSSMLKDLPHKVRSDVRKAMKAPFSAEWLGEDGLEDFYRIFAINMRELGTPAYGKVFFREILRAFPQQTAICLVRLAGKPVAASFLMGYRETLEAGWSSSLYDYLALKPNMFLYWSIFGLAGRRGYRVFDFGRSSVGSGAHRFKMQWGSQEVPLYWAYWVPEGGALPELNPQNPRYRVAVEAWKRLPLSFTNWLGPKIARLLP